jgi:uncharacterized membrane protein (UPF0127 family)
MTNKIKLYTILIFSALYLSYLNYNLKESKTTITLGSHLLTVDTASNDYKIAKGLMFKKELEGYEGLLFIFKEKGIHPFWMKHTLMDLDIAFIEENGQVLEIKSMVSKSEEEIRPSKEIKYALEVPKDFFKNKGIKEGDLLILPIPLNP